MSLAQPLLPAVPRVALWLGVAGLAPFYGAALAAWLSTDSSVLGMAFYGQIGYAAVVASFLGAVHWGLAIGHMQSAGPTPPVMRQMGFSVVPAVIAWLALLLKPLYGLAVLMGLFVALLMRDRAAVRNGLAPAWYATLRLPLTILVEIALAATLIRFMTLG